MASTFAEKMTTVDDNDGDSAPAPQAAPRKYEIKYISALQLLLLHLSGLYGLYLSFTSAHWYTLVFNSVLQVMAIVGIAAGAHRLWCHRAYKASLPLQILLMLLHTLSFEDHAARWARDHRLHHKYTDTDTDPHNATRGLFYSHIGWLLVKKHPAVINKGKTIDVKDIYDNPVLHFQTKYYLPLVISITFVVPTLIPMYYWGEDMITAFNISSLRLIAVLHSSFLVNNAAHAFGYKPYDANITPTQSIPLSLATLGEGFHNYTPHHVFPFDYRTGEFGNNHANFSTKFIDFFAWIGWAYDLRTASDEMIANRAKRTGDGTDLSGNRRKDTDETHDSDDDNNEEYKRNSVYSEARKRSDLSKDYF